MAISVGRQFWVVVHRWAGLTMALFLIVAGATGALLPFQRELTFLGRPVLSRVAPPMPGAQPLDGAELALRAERATGGKVIFTPLRPEPGHVTLIGVTSRAGRPPLGYDTVWVDPYSAQIRLRFRYGVLADGPQNIMPFLYQLHFTLVAGQWGRWIMGVAALIWTLDCFVGFYLTLPPRPKTASVPPTGPARLWLTRWKPSWQVRWRSRGHKLNFDLHRAGGLWVWPALLVFALSSVSYNLPTFYRSVMEPLGLSKAFQPASLSKPQDDPPVRLTRAREIGARLMRGEADRRDFSIFKEGFLFYLPDAGLYAYTARTSLDPSSDDAQTSVWFSASDGGLVRFETPTGPSAADIFTQWLGLLHRAEVFGLAYRIFVSVFGVGVVALSVTGIAIWMKKRSARILGRSRKSKTPN